jgi:hypothetical protein
MELNSRAQSTVNVILFVTLLLAAIIIATWYASTIRPNKDIIGRLSDDVAAIRRHILNACDSRTYIATYPLATRIGRLEAREDGFCIESGQFRKCSDALCPLEPADFTLNSTLLTIERRAYGLVLLRNT